MSNFSPKLEDATDDQLKYWINETDARLASLASDELTRRRLKELQETIQDLNRNTMRYSRRLIDLTLLLFFVALIQVLISVVGVPENWLSKVLVLGIVIYAIYYAARHILENKKVK